VRCDHNVYWSSRKALVSLAITLIKCEFSQKIFEKFPKNKPHENPSCKRRVIPCGGKDGRRDRHEEANILLSQFCERVLESLVWRSCFSVTSNQRWIRSRVFNSIHDYQ